MCELPAGHRGAHSFHLEQTGARVPSPEMRQRMDGLSRQAGADLPPSQVTGDYRAHAEALAVTL